MQLNQYYTNNIYGDALVKNLTIASPKTALDLGFGAGDLLCAAKRRWDNLSLIGIDIDKKNILNAETNKIIKALELSGFDPSLPNIINDNFGEIDLLISNPPYFSCDLDYNNKKILEAIGLLDCISKNLNKVPAELIFLAQNLRLLTKTGEIGIIVPAGLISGQRWLPVRQFLFEKYDITNIIQLPEASFKKTDAQTFIITLKYKTKELKSIPLSYIDKENVINVNISNAVVRADYRFYKEITTLEHIDKISNEDFEMYRGNKSHNELLKIGNAHIHTTDMPHEPTKIDIKTNKVNDIKNAKTNDILIARVGRRCLGRTLYIHSGFVPISDCIIGITPKNEVIGDKIWKKLSSMQCKKYLTNAALGVGAKYITYKTIRDYLTNEYATTK
jgi:type I restriction-modification system DNA methylase subunit